MTYESRCKLSGTFLWFTV